MAVKNIIPMKMAWDVLSDPISFTAPTSAADGFSIPYTEQDAKTVILVQGGASAGTLTIKKGNSIQGVADSEAFAVPAGGFKAITVESGKFKNVSGANKGNVIAVPSAADIKLAAIVLP